MSVELFHTGYHLSKLVYSAHWHIVEGTGVYEVFTSVCDGREEKWIFHGSK